MDKSTTTDFTSVIEGMADLYEASICNGFYLPKQSSSIITEEYLLQVIKGEVWCPRYKDIRLSPCPWPPSKKTPWISCMDWLIRKNTSLVWIKSTSQTKLGR